MAAIYADTAVSSSDHLAHECRLEQCLRALHGRRALRWAAAAWKAPTSWWFKRGSRARGCVTGDHRRGLLQSQHGPGVLDFQ